MVGGRLSRGLYMLSFSAELPLQNLLCILHERCSLQVCEELALMWRWGRTCSLLQPSVYLPVRVSVTCATPVYLGRPTSCVCGHSSAIPCTSVFLRDRGCLDSNHVHVTLTEQLNPGILGFLTCIMGMRTVSTSQDN